MTFLTNSEEETVRAGEKFAETLRAGDVILYRGEMGAGKTHFTKGIALGLGVADVVSSPTFALVNEYLDGRLPLFHFDLFRIDTFDDLYAIGFFDYLDRGGVLAVEWSENIPALGEELESVRFVELKKIGENAREIRIIERSGKERT
ncbi:MAG: tRNA (adenosine(37)-N6)-threonylcarbamoyltransferase complex ATPase subunit type 1 TsaE [Bacteroides sp.]|nr:tRNA (adenosine(37)-N6)-threonylcarbamoyltransferase complex ATPase subunit type 1 TsaE [Eubacterium sp.]MCM1418872.1 tRNA (adenosine(37)-N6)-threonylcarbamoyltransferase complex ATPase subunit type 1 TsaE [Roseburia sp.]MCM1463337.1 tRNA (adenosine(37)-N6)-threonylcarbamoyltransferase complex ATPase subunit type 1 TsaE [Bacteroides sp.]